MKLSESVAVLQDFKAKNPTANKAVVEEFFASITGLVKARSVYASMAYAIRFSEANSRSFSNVVLSLSALQNYDHIPFVICIVRPDRLDFRLSNSTFLKRISHSSHNLTPTNIKGSFLGHDIVDSYDSIPNRPENFDQLAAIHAKYNWSENVERLVEATTAIIARSTRYVETPDGISSIFESPTRAFAALNSTRFKAIEGELSALTLKNRQLLLQAAALDNVNIRGNTIEQLITGTINAHRLDDLEFSLDNGARLIIDIKTKLLDRASAPKAYNIDKMLALLSRPGTIFTFFFVGLNASQNICQSRLVSIFDPVIVNATRIQTHWAGRASRGVTQLTGDIYPIFDSRYKPSVDIERGISLLRSFIER
jgi:hypothetical protein